MHFSTKAEYGLRAMVVLAHSYPNIKNIKEISQEEKISAKYLEQLMKRLREGGLIQSLKGKGGGYILAKKPAMIKVGKIIELLEDDFGKIKCQSPECANAKCPSKKVWLRLDKEIKKVLNGIKLSEL